MTVPVEGILSKLVTNGPAKGNDAGKANQLEIAATKRSNPWSNLKSWLRERRSPKTPTLLIQASSAVITISVAIHIYLSGHGQTLILEKPSEPRANVRLNRAL